MRTVIAILLAFLPALSPAQQDPQQTTLNWFAVFSFSGTGYIKDDEKINPDRSSTIRPACWDDQAS